MFFRLFTYAGIALLATSTCAAELQMHDAWVAAAPPVAKTQAAYVALANTSDHDIEIMDISAKGFGMVTMHKMIMQGDMAVMEDMPTLLIPAHQTITLAPGGMHIMLMDAKKMAMPGEKVVLTFQYQDGTKQTFTLEVKTSDNKSATDVKAMHHHE